MNRVTTDESLEKKENGKRHINVNIGLLAGLFGGAILGGVLGAVAHDVPRYTGFGMILGMAISVDLNAYIKSKEEKNSENDEMRE
ncbi:MAG: hypothetical protein K2H41_09060 [Acetatifactor sp.]|nr:hypothetical protein [Acetatifactor sp.]